MGIKGLTKLLGDHAPRAMREAKLESFFGRKIAIDASMAMYQVCSLFGVYVWGGARESGLNSFIHCSLSLLCGLVMAPLLLPTRRGK